MFECELPDTAIVIFQPFWPAYLTAERIAEAPKLKLAITAGIGGQIQALLSVLCQLVIARMRLWPGVSYLFFSRMRGGEAVRARLTTRSNCARLYWRAHRELILRLSGAAGAQGNVAITAAKWHYSKMSADV